MIISDILYWIGQNLIEKLSTLVQQKDNPERVNDLFPHRNDSDFI